MDSKNTLSSMEMIQWYEDIKKCTFTRYNRGITKLIKRYPANTTDDYGKTLFHYVLEENSSEKIIKYLIEAHFNVNAKDNDGKTALMLAIEEEKVKTVKSLLNSNAIIEHTYYPDNNGPLHVATRVECVELVKMLLDAGCNVNAKNIQNKTPLIIAILSKNVEVARILLDAGASRNHTYYDDNTGPLHLACKFINLEMVKLFLDSGYDVSAVDHRRYTPLHYILDCEKPPNDNNNVRNIVKLLIEAGANVNVKNNYGSTPLHCAATSYHNDVVDLLLKTGAKLDAINDKTGNTPLLQLLYFESLNPVDENIYLPIAKQLIKAGTDINKINARGQTSIFYAAVLASVELLNLLIEHGARLDLLSNNNFGPLAYAVSNWWWDTGNFYRNLVIQNQFLNCDEIIERKFGKNRIGSQIKCVKILCKSGCNVNQIIKKDTTVLGFALEYGQSKIIKELLLQGAILDIKNLKWIRNLKIKRILIRHTALCYLHKNGQGIVNFDIQRFNRKQAGYYTTCLEELKKLKDFRVYESMPLLNLIDGIVTSYYISSKKLIRAFKTGFIARSFPIFNDVLTERFEEEREKFETIAKATAVLQKLMKLDGYCFDLIYHNILIYLKINDIRTVASLMNTKTSESSDEL